MSQEVYLAGEDLFSSEQFGESGLSQAPAECDGHSSEACVTDRQDAVEKSVDASSSEAGLAPSSTML
jgi:hypothetical protein